ncbi:MAG: CDP-alcohol phosphatidyltransferase family protein [Proteobacteria bacterium]|nr:CDP-alcohol phosphatidyltransferase family protein [Pseudomonadota bacterium]
MFLGIYNPPAAISFLGIMLSSTAIYLSFNNHFNYAVICFIYAGICDLFDGLIARKFDRTEEEKLFGVQIDSIIDMASFGITPCMLILHSGFDTKPDLFLILFYICAAAMRLAYFNVHGTKEIKGTAFYTGLPVTFSALIFPSVFILHDMACENLYRFIVRSVFFIVAVLFVLKISIPKPKGIFYFVFLLLAIFYTVYWL